MEGLGSYSCLAKHRVKYEVAQMWWPSSLVARQNAQPRKARRSRFKNQRDQQIRLSLFRNKLFFRRRSFRIHLLCARTHTPVSRRRCFSFSMNSKVQRREKKWGGATHPCIVAREWLMIEEGAVKYAGLRIPSLRKRCFRLDRCEKYYLPSSKLEINLCRPRSNFYFQIRSNTITKSTFYCWIENGTRIRENIKSTILETWD